ncbi:MAG: PSD1 and planctomycete cytochrome C domain-containing protein [Bryobacteraceae bacterium]
MPGSPGGRVVGAITLLLCLPAALAAGVSFTQSIRPVLARSCWNCHGGAAQLSGLDLRTRETALTGGTRGAAILPGKPEDSRLYRLIAGLEKPGMPMDGKLPAAEVNLFRQWIAEGAPWEGSTADLPKAASTRSLEDYEIPTEARKWWAYQRPQQTTPPTAGEFTHAVDRFLEARRQAKGLKAAGPADRATLVRRAYLDLIGLPPTPQQAAEFIGDRSPDAWPRLIERLLASPHYGERWGRHWLDVARYADSNGFEHDFDRPNAWRYRDYVVRAFNQDTPYHRFLSEQLAGDELDEVTNDSLIATGFLRCHAKVGFREKDNPPYRYEYLDDMIATIGRGILGLTVHCARCHNHKFDAIPQKDYYQLQASLFSYVEVDHPLVPKAEADAYRAQLASVEARLKPLRDELREMEAPYRERIVQEKYKRYPEHIQKAIATPEAERTPGQVLLANQIIRTTNAATTEIDKLLPPQLMERKRVLLERMRGIERERPKPIPMAMGITDGDYRFAPDGPGDEPAPGKGMKREAIDGSFLHQGPGRYQPPDSFFLIRGDIHSRGSRIEPGFLTAATYGNPATSHPPSDGRTSGRRRALAEWLGSRDNPLTARVIVNRIWHHHFGRGIVPTLDNFGRNGEPPTHPELLDWLAVEFMNQGWSLKQAHRLIMTSKAYQMASRGGPESAANLEKDPDNTLLWRYRPQRLDAEVVRDQMLAVAGALQKDIGGPPVFPPLPPEVLEQMKYGIWKRDTDGPNVWRRSLYVYRKRGLPFPFFEVFDLPDQNSTCGRRNVSTVPTQALTLLNNDFVLKHSSLLALRVLEAEPADRDRQIDLAYHLALARSPLEAERATAREFLKARSFDAFAHVLFNLNEFLYMR